MRNVRCNRCGDTVELPFHGPSNPAPRVPSGWGQMSMIHGFSGRTVWYDMCHECTQAMLTRFMVGDEVKPITVEPVDPADTDVSVLTHAPTLDCQWMINPATGKMICRHDDEEMFAALFADWWTRNATGDESDALEKCVECGTFVPRFHLVLHMRETHPDPVVRCVCDDHVHTYNREVSQSCVLAGCHCKTAERGAFFTKTPLPINTDSGPLTQVSDDLRATNERNEKTIRAAVKCPPACSEQHTYQGDCLLSVIYQTSVPRQTRQNDEGE